MAYRRPGVTVTQEFAELVPALAEFNLPTVMIGPSYLLVNDDLMGTYSGSLQVYTYPSLVVGFEVDLEEEDSAEQFPASKKPISVEMADVVTEILAEVGTGAGSGQAFSDLTGSIFADVLQGDLVSIVEKLNESIIAAQTNGVSTDTAGLRDRLTAGTSGQFASVKVGDTVTVTGGTNTNTGSFTVLIKISDDVLKLSADVNDGGGVSADVAYTIDGDRGTNNVGDFRIKSKTDDNNLVLESPLNENESPLTYSIKREVGTIEIPRVATLFDPGFVASAADISIPAGLQSAGFDILEGNVSSSHRMLRNDLAANVAEFAKLSDVTAFFGTDQVTPQNPLAFALQIALQNTVTPVNSLGLDANAVSDEVQSHLNALDVLSLTEMYALVPLSQNPALPPLYKSHVEGFSDPEQKLERVAILNRLLKEIETLSSDDTIVSTVAGSRTVVSTQVDGIADFTGDDKNLNDVTTDAFLNVELGDTVTIVSGTSSVPGEFQVVTKTDNNNIILSAAIITAGTESDFVYFISRKDGLAANGQNFYDRNATFITSGISAGHYLTINDGAYAGRYKIGSVISEKELILQVTINGVTSLQTGMNYDVDRNLSRTEQADFIKGFSESLSSRRIVMTWPDVLNTPVGPDVEPLPGYYAGAVVGALTTGLPTQQGLTNLSVSGFLGFEHSTGYFTEAQLDLIAEGGTMVFAQAGAEQPLFIRHQLTTDRSSVKFQEYSITKNVDFIAKFLRNNFLSFIGQYNIVETTLDELRTGAAGIITFLRDDTKIPRFGGVIRSGILKSIEEDAVVLDRVTMRFKFNIPIPLNNLDITIEV